MGVGEPDTDITPQAMDVLAALAGMGISPQVRHCGRCDAVKGEWRGAAQ